jgi:hypothetical protein
MQIHQVEYSVSANIPFVLYDTNGSNIINTPTFQMGDVLISLDGQTATSATNLPVLLGNSYSLILTSAESTCRQAVVTIIDTSPTKTWLDTSFVVETYGTSASYHPDIGSISNTIDGVGINDTLEYILAAAIGNFTRSGDQLTWYAQDGVTPLFILSGGWGGRTRTDV